MLDAQPPATSPPHDRSLRLRLFGILAILVGCGCAALGLLHLVLLAASGRPGFETIPVDVRTSVMGALLYGCLGAAFAWVGWGSIQRRRWVRPLMLTLCWCWLLAGMSVLLLLPSLLQTTLGSLPSGAAIDSTLRSAFLWVALGIVAVLGLLLPAIFIWVYNDRNVQRTCETHDPVDRWTESCPSPVLGLSVAMAAGGVLIALMALRPAVPLFGMLLVGWPAALLLVGCAGGCLWLAREIYGQSPRGWWATTLALVLLGLSTWVTLELAEPEELYAALGYPPMAPLPDDRFLSLTGWLTLGMTLITVAYLLHIRKYFRMQRVERGRDAKR